MAGAAGTDWSQQAAAQYAVTDGVTAGSTTITSATANFGTDVVGNIVYVAGGTGSITGGWYQIASRTNATTVVVDRSTGLTAGTGVTLNIGGALDGLATLASAMVASNRAFIQTSGGYTITAAVTFGQAGVFPAATVTATRLTGYTTTRGDNGKAVITFSTNSSLKITISNTGWIIENLSINCASLGSSIGLLLSSGYSSIRNVKVSNATSVGIEVLGANTSITDSEITGCTAAAGEAIYAFGSGPIARCNIHDNACTGIVQAGSNISVYQNLITNNTGATSDGINNGPGFNAVVEHNTIYGSGRHGINGTAATSIAANVRNNLLVGNGGYGFVLANAAGSPADPLFDGNAYYNNTSGARHFMDDTGSVNPIDAVAPYANVLDVILTADPFVAKASNDYRLNTTAGGGAACRGFGVPTTWPGNSLTTSYPDMGASQHIDPAAANLSRVFSGF